MFLSLSHKNCLSIHPGLSKCIEEEILLITIFISRECTIYLHKARGGRGSRSVNDGSGHESDE